METVSLETTGGGAAEACLGGCPADAARDQLLQWAQSRFGEDEFVKAKEEFFWKTGKVFYDDSFYDARMEYFIDYFLLERPLSHPYDGEICLTPFETYRRFVDSGALPGLGQSEHALLQIGKVSINKITAANLISGEQVEIYPRTFETFRAISKKEIIQGFLYSSEQKFFFSKGMIFHPMKANRFIRKELKKLQTASDFDASGFLAALAKLQLRHLRHAHVDPKRIYCPS